MTVNSTSSFLHGLSGTTAIPMTASSKRPKQLPPDVTSLIVPGRAPREAEGPTDNDAYGAHRVTLDMTNTMDPADFDQLTAEHPTYSLSDGAHNQRTALSVTIAGRYSTTFITHILDRDRSLVNRGMGDGHLTPLMLTCLNPERLALMRFFISNQADINLSDKEGGTALVHAATKNNVGAMKYLILRGAIIYQDSLDEAESGSRILLNLAGAIEQLRGVQCFMRGTLHHSERSDSIVSRLPEELRIKIGSFVEG